MTKAAAKKEQYYGTGRRKTATARAFLKRGSGKITVKSERVSRALEEYFACPTARQIARQPLEVVGLGDKIDINVTVKGGGPMGQAGAVRHAITRALIAYDESTAPLLKPEEAQAETSANGVAGITNLADAKSFRKLLRKVGFVTRDSRVVERKKYGFRKARKRSQYSKR